MYLPSFNLELQIFGRWHFPDLPLQFHWWDLAWKCKKCWPFHLSPLFAFHYENTLRVIRPLRCQCRHPNEVQSLINIVSGYRTFDFCPQEQKLSIQDIKDEFNGLFIGMGRGELLPYGSYYLTGFLNEKPLAKLWNSMRDLSIERQEKIKEPEIPKFV